MREPAIIARISLANALAVERQIEDGKAYFARLGRAVPPDNIFIDNGVSASAFSTKERREYLRALTKIEAGDIDHIWMWAEDRTHRQVIELAEFIQLCREHSVRVATAGTEYDLSDPDQVSMWFIKVRFAETEVEKLSRRMKRQTLQAAEKGLPHPTGRRAFGERGRRRVKDDDGNLKTVPVGLSRRLGRPPGAAVRPLRTHHWDRPVRPAGRPGHDRRAVPLGQAGVLGG
jgi:DNA invertase Pin-like site-specific DNA recombinase